MQHAAHRRPHALQRTLTARSFDGLRRETDSGDDRADLDPGERAASSGFARGPKGNVLFQQFVADRLCETAY